MNSTSPSTLSLPVRILYTINANPQYILARSHEKLPTTIIPPYNNGAQEGETDGQPAYATCALNACLDAICRSSPELVQDSMRDFSVYVLDPLESMSPSGSSTSTPNDPRGVAIGLGLMSWALLADEDDPVEVTGTVIKQGNGMGALEVIFSLKETTHMQKASLSPTLKSWGLHSQAPSLASRLPTTTSTSKRNKPHRSISTTTRHSKDTPASGSSTRRTSSASKEPCSPSFTTNVFSLTPARTFTSYDTHVTPNFSSTHSANPTSNSDLPSLSNTTSTPSEVEAGKTERRYARSSDFPTSDSAIYLGPPRRIGRPPKSTQSNNKPNTKTKPNGLKSFITPRRQDVFTRVPLSVPGGTARQIEGDNGKGKERESAGGQRQGQADDDLKSLLAALSSASSLSTDNGTTLLSALAAIDSTSGEGNGALVMALKELLTHVSALPSPPKPTVNPTDIYTTATSGQANHERSNSDDIIVLDKENVNPEVFRRRSEKDKENAGNIAGSGAGAEKRGLGGSSNANSTAGRKRTLSDFMEEKEKEKAKNKTRNRARTGSSGVHSLSSSSSVHAHAYNQSSGSQYYRSATDTLPSRAHTSPPRPKPFRRLATASSTATASSLAPAPEAKAKKPFTLPAWARTTNPTQPRLSEEALKAKERAEAEAEAERERTKKRRGSRRARDNQNENQNERQDEKTRTKPTHATGKPPQLTVYTRAQTISLPVCASSDLTVVSPSSPVPASSPSEGGGDASDMPPHASSQELPRTPPPRTRRRHTLATTPLTRSIGTSGGSALFTPTPRKTIGGLFGDSPLLSPSVSKSMSALRVKAKISPTQVIGTGQDYDSGEDDESDKFNKQFSDALEDPEFPPSSLPIASSDFDTDPPATSSSGGQTATETTIDEDETVRFWSSGLPPSSPPPPTSPILQVQTDGEEMDDISTIPSDSEGFVFEPELQEDHQQQLAATPSDFESEFPFSDGMGMCFDDFNQLFSGHMTWTHTDAAQDTPMLLANGGDGTIQNGLNDFDFSQFWESVKPLVSNQSMVAGGDMFAQQDGGEVDHAKLAADVQALFSGCLM